MVNPEMVPATASTGTVEVLQGIENQPVWAVPYGREFWCRAASDQTTSNPASATGLLTTDSIGLQRTKGFDDTMERVSHAITPDAERQQLLVQASTYTASFGPDGFRLVSAHGRAPNQRSAPTGTALTFRTGSVRVGAEALYEGTGGARQTFALCNTAQVLLNAPAGLVEHVEARGDGVAVSWVLQHPAPAPPTGELVVRAEFEGATFTGATSQGFHFADDASGQDFLVKRAVATDSRGHRWRMAMHVTRGGVVFSLPSQCLLHAAHPLAVASLVTPCGAFPGQGLKQAAPATSPAAETHARPQQTLSLTNSFDAARVKQTLPCMPHAEYHAAALSASPDPFATASRKASGDPAVIERATLLEMRDQLLLFHGLARNRLGEGIPHDRNILEGQARSWRNLADGREEKGRKSYATYHEHVERAYGLLATYEPSGGRDTARRVAQRIQNFTILPFTTEGEQAANQLERALRTQLPEVFYGLRAGGEPGHAVFTSLREAVRDAGLFHYYVTAARATRAGQAAHWAQRLADHDAHSNAYAAARQPLFAQNLEVVRKIAELGSLADICLENQRTGANTEEPLSSFHRALNDLKQAVGHAPLAHVGDLTVTEQLAQLRLAYSELLDAKLDLADYTSATFRGLQVEARLASIEAKLENARDEARKQLVAPDETLWRLLGIRSIEEAQDVLNGRQQLTAKLGAWLRLVREWRAAVARQPSNNFATLQFLTSFVRNKAEWDHLLVTEVYPVLWQHAPATLAEQLRKQDFRRGASVELSMNTILGDLREIWQCYGEY